MNGADIQLENGGWTRIHNAILEKLAQVRMGGYEFRCVFYLLRMTYGYQRKEAEISMKEWSEATGLNSGNVGRALRNLIKWRVVLKTSAGNGRGHKSTYAFNKYHEQWFAEENSVAEDTVLNSVAEDTVSTHKQCQKAPINSVKNGHSTSSPKERKKTRERKGGGIDPHLTAPKREQAAQESIALADDAGLTPKQLRENTDTVLEITALKRLVDAGDDRKLRDAQDVAVLLAKLGYGTRDALLELHDRWRGKNSWRSNPIPSLHNLKEFASQDLAEQVAQVSEYAGITLVPLGDAQ